MLPVGHPWGSLQWQPSRGAPQLPAWQASSCPVHGAVPDRQTGQPTATRAPTAIQAISTRSTTSPPPRDTSSRPSVSLTSNSVVLLPPSLSTSPVKHPRDSQLAAEIQIQVRELHAQEPPLPPWVQEDTQDELAALWELTSTLLEPRLHDEATLSPAAHPAPQLPGHTLSPGHHLVLLPPLHDSATPSDEMQQQPGQSAQHTPAQRTRRRHQSDRESSHIPHQHTVHQHHPQAPLASVSQLHTPTNAAVPTTQGSPGLTAAEHTTTAHELLAPSEAQPLLQRLVHTHTTAPATTPPTPQRTRAAAARHTHAAPTSKPRADQLTRDLSSTGSVQQLAACVAKLAPRMDAGHIATAASRLAHIVSSAPDAQQQHDQLSATSAQSAATAAPPQPPPTTISTATLQLLPPPPLPPPARSNTPQAQSAPVKLSQQQLSAPDLNAANQLVLLLLRLSNPLLLTFHPTSAITTLWAFAQLHEAGITLGLKRTTREFEPTRQPIWAGPSTNNNSRHHHYQSSSDAGSVHSLRVDVPSSAIKRCHAQDQSDVFQAGDDSHQALLQAVLTALGDAASQGVSFPDLYRLRSSLYCELAWAAAVLQLGDAVPDLWPPLVAALPRQVKHMSARDACGTAWALVKAHQYDPELFSMIQDRAGELVARFLEVSRPATARRDRVQPDKDAGGQPGRPIAAAHSTQAGRRQHQAGHAGAQKRSSMGMRWQLRDDTKAALTGQDLSQLMWSFSRVGHPLHQLMPDLEVAALKLVPQMSPQHMANIAWGLAMQRIRAPRLSGLIFSRAAGMLDELEVHHIAQLAWAAAKQRSFSQILGADTDLGWLNTKQAGSSSLASASSTHTDTPVLTETQLLAAFAPVVAARMEQVSVQDGVLLAWAYAHSGVPAQPLLTCLAGRLRGRLEECDHRGMATLLWAYVKQRVWDEALYDSLLTALSHKPLEQVHAGSLQMVVWALGHLAEGGPAPEGTPAGLHLVNRHRQLTQRLAVILQSQLMRCTGQELSNLAWAFAQLGHTHPGLFEDIAACVISNRHAGTHRNSNRESPTAGSDSPIPHEIELGKKSRTHVQQQGMSTSAGRSRDRSSRAAAGVPQQGTWGVRRLRWDKAAMRGGWSVVQQLKSLECAKLVWAFAKVGHVHEELFQAVSERVCYLAALPAPGQTLVQAVPIGAAARTMWAFAMQGMHGDRVLGRLIPCAGAALDLGQPRDVAAIMWALASAGRLDEDEQLTSSCIAYAARHAKYFRGSHLCDVMWALGCAAQQAPAHVHHMCELAGPLVDHVLLRLRHAPHTFKVSELSNIMWSLVQLQRDEQHVTQHVAQHVAGVLKQQQQHMPASTRSGHHLVNASPTLAAAALPASPAHSLPSAPDVQQHAPLLSTALEPVQGWEPEHLVLLVHSLASMGHFHPGLFSQVAQSLMSELDVLDTEHLVLLVWAFASTLHLASAAGVEDVQGRLLAAAEEMLEQVAPPSRPSALTPEELHLLWQSHQCCQLWAGTELSTFQGTASMIHTNTTAAAGSAGSSVLCCCHGPPHLHMRHTRSQHVIHNNHLACGVFGSALSAAPFKLHPELIDHMLHVAKPGRRNGSGRAAAILSEVEGCLADLGLRVLSADGVRLKPGREQSSVELIEQVLAGCGMHWLACVQGGRQVVVVLTRQAGLTGTQRVAGRLLGHLGHDMVFVQLPGWRRLKTAEGRAKYLQRKLGQRAGKQNVLSH